MDYKGNLCPGCNTAFSDGDDIVVCPECGTPQHRECYEKENRCVNNDKHAEGFVWQGTVRKEPAVKAERTDRSENVTCPNCGASNPRGTEVCHNCGLKFTVFGMNVVDAIHEKENTDINADSNIPDYKPPFTLGEGEGFDSEQKQKEAVAADFVKTVFTQMLEEKLGEDSDGSKAENNRLTFEGPFPESDEIGGIKTNTVGTFVGQNGLSYISKFKKIQSGSLLSFNFAAFFFTPYWFFFRKLYKAGIAFMTALIALSIIFVEPNNRFLELIEQLYTVETQAQYDTVMLAMSEVLPSVTLFMLLTFSIKLICGFTANHIYKKYVLTHAGNAEKLPQKKLAMTYIVKNGGASLLIAGASYFAQQLISMLVSYVLSM